MYQALFHVAARVSSVVLIVVALAWVASYHIQSQSSKLQPPHFEVHSRQGHLQVTCRFGGVPKPGSSQQIIWAAPRAKLFGISVFRLHASWGNATKVDIPYSHLAVAAGITPAVWLGLAVGRRCRPAGRCVGCGYNLKGIIDAGRSACPECGRPIDIMHRPKPARLH
jgi:DNA-directed RNA polymerase subunit RPC12/RpoP